MKVAILAGGWGTRLAEETDIRPKPMVEIGGKPIIWHIMMHYSTFGFREFAVALGYKGDMLKRWMANYAQMEGDLKVSTHSGTIERRNFTSPDWDVDLVETGLYTQTGGRMAGLRDTLSGEAFMLTYGDGVSNVDIKALLDFHKSHGKLATMTIVRPRARFGHVEIDGDMVVDFSEKAETAEGWINGGFFVMEPEVIDYVDGPECVLENTVLSRLSQENQLAAYQHPGFWQCMDTLREKRMLEKMWNSGNAEWATWKGN